MEVKNLDQPLVCCVVTWVWPSEGWADHLTWTWIGYQKSKKLRLAHKTSIYWLELLIRKVKNSDWPIRLLSNDLNYLSENSRNLDQSIRLWPDLNCWSEKSKTWTSPFNFYLMTWIEVWVPVTAKKCVACCFRLLGFMPVSHNLAATCQ